MLLVVLPFAVTNESATSVRRALVCTSRTPLVAKELGF